MSVLSVTEVSKILEATLKGAPQLNHICIEGEMSKVTYHTSGHLYFDLKDKESVISCAAFSYRNKRIPLDLKPGDNVQIITTMSYYATSGKVTFSVLSLSKKDTQGELLKEYERLRKEFEAKGYFDDNRKKKKPRLVKRIGVVTSKTGDVIHDIEQTTNNRDKNVQIYLYNSKVQGEGAAEQIVQGIRFFNENLDKYPVDAIIVGRGGGSIEDLWVYNDPRIVEAIYASNIFVVSSVGHGSNTVLTDFVADRRASTPTQAAEFLVSVQEEELDKLNVYKSKIQKYKDIKFNNCKEKLLNLKDSYILRNYNSRIDKGRMRLVDLEEDATKALKNHFKLSTHKLETLKDKVTLKHISSKVEKSYSDLNDIKKACLVLLNSKIEKYKHDLEKQQLRLEKHSVNDILDKGYTITLLNGKVANLSDLKEADVIETRFKDGSIESIVKGGN